MALGLGLGAAAVLLMSGSSGLQALAALVLLGALGAAFPVLLAREQQDPKE